jgi:hypothetical protein
MVVAGWQLFIHKPTRLPSNANRIVISSMLQQSKNRAHADALSLLLVLVLTLDNASALHEVLFLCASIFSGARVRFISAEIARSAPPAWRRCV